MLMVRRCGELNLLMHEHRAGGTCEQHADEDAIDECDLCERLRAKRKRVDSTNNDDCPLARVSQSVLGIRQSEHNSG